MSDIDHAIYYLDTVGLTHDADAVRYLRAQLSERHDLWKAAMLDAAEAGKELSEVRRQLSEAQARLACTVQWTKDQPTAPGAYWVRGWMLGDPSLEALVEVRLDETLADEAEGSILVCNLHESNSDTEIESWSPVSCMSGKFEWLGPLYAAQQQKEGGA